MKLVIALIACTAAYAQTALPVTGIAATFHDGQTFVSYGEPYTGAAGANFRYYIYRSLSPITDSTSLAAATLIQSGVFNNGGQRTAQFPYNQTTRQDASKLMAITVQGSCPGSGPCGTPLASGSGLAVHTATNTSAAYYAVITHDRTSALADSPVSAGSNATTTPISEAVGTIQPLKYLDSHDTTAGQTSGWGVTGATGLPLWVRLHASGGSSGAAPIGDLWTLWGDSTMGYQEGVQQAFTVGQAASAYPSGTPATALALRPLDETWTDDGLGSFETFWFGYLANPLGQPSGRAWPFTEKWLSYVIPWTISHYSADPNRVYAFGHSMGGWGSISYLLAQNPSPFAAIFAELPRWTETGTGGNLQLPSMIAKGTVTPTTGQLMSDGVTTYANRMDTPARYSAPNCAVNLPFIAFGIGRNDDFASWADQTAALAALKACHYGFAFQWDNGNHNTSNGLDQLAPQYQTVFAKNVSFPAFTNSSLDSDVTSGCSTDPATGTQTSRCFINQGWAWTILTDTANSWSATITNSLGAATVDITPRNTQAFRPAVGQSIVYTLSTGASGSVIVDAYGLVTVPAASISGTTTVTLARVKNTITLRNNTGSSAASYPLQFARPFVAGEITNYPQMGLCADSTCGTVSSWLTTQADVKVRWPDGSVKHAILSVLLSSVATGNSYYTFRNQVTCNCGVASALTKAQMLDVGYDFDAQIQGVAGGITKSASARAMLDDWPQTTLAAAITSTSSTAVTVSSGAGFPAAPFHALIDTEDVKVTSKGAGTNWTVVRGANGTTPATHAIGAELWDTRVSYWVSGSVATTIVLADFSENHLYDFGWEGTCDMTLTSPVSPTATTAAVADASCLVTPTYARLWRPFASASFDNAGADSEAVYVCGKSGNTLQFGAPGCATVPSVAGRAQRQYSLANLPALAFITTDKVTADNAWQSPSSVVFNSVKPIFVATFWPGPNKVYVRAVAENGDTERMQDQIYDVTVTTGSAFPVTRLSQSNFLQSHATSWTRSYWIGADPPTIDIVHNIAYLASTGLTYNYDPSRAPSNAAMDPWWDVLQERGTALGSLGPYTMYGMGASGGRPEIGPESGWWVWWMYTGYDKMKQVVFAAADMANSWTSVVREGNPAKHYDSALTIEGFGKPATAAQRKTINLTTGYNYTSTLSDTIQPVGAFSSWPFTGFDTEHIYNLTMPVYMVTGDYYYLQMSEEWASMINLMASPNTDYGRGPTGAEGFIGGNVRKMSWVLRGRDGLASLIPDDMVPEKAMYTGLVRDYIAGYEGISRFTNSYPSDPAYTTMYNWGRNVYPGDSQGETVQGAISPMGVYYANQGFVQGDYGIDTTFVGGASSLYEQGYMTVVLGLGKTMGLYTTAINKSLARLKTFYQQAATNPAYNPFLLATGRVPTAYNTTPLTLINNWADMKKGYWPTLLEASTTCSCIFPEWQGVASFPKTDPQHGYDAISLAALATVSTPTDAAWAGFGGGQQASFTLLNDTPTWAILPFGASPVTAVTGLFPLPSPIIKR